MDFFGDIGRISEVSGIKESEEKSISKKALDKFDKLMGDDKLEGINNKDVEDVSALTPAETEDKFDKLMGDEVCETDDNGLVYKKNGELLPETEYTVNGNVYKTDIYGNIVSCDSVPEYTEEGVRNIKEQRESGGDERHEDDDGGHIIARILGGAEGEENLVPMRRTINRGDYKRMENEISKALQEGKEAVVHVDLEYEDGSGRPSKIRAEYTIDDRKTVCEFDNVEGSTDLLYSLEDKISAEDYDRLKRNISEMKEDGCEAAVTSVKVEYNESGERTKVTIGILDESDGTKRYREYDPV
jgi:hypothetical protein